MNDSSALRALLWPAQPRQFRGQRWLNITLRSLHLVGVAGAGGGFLYPVSPEHWLPFWYLTLFSGGALVLLYLWSSALWLCQLKGLVILLKLALLAAALWLPAWRGPLLLAVVVLSALIAHAPGKLRGWRWLAAGAHSAETSA